LEQAKRESAAWELIQVHGAGLDSLTAICDKYNSLLIESHHLHYDLFQQLSGALKPELIPLGNLVENFRAVKDTVELDLLREAARIGDRVFTHICEEIKVGLSERHIANRIVYLLKEEGCSQESFPTIAVAGENAALPHGQPGERQLQYGDMLTMDFGGFYHGYAGDMTRTVALGKISSRIRDIYDRVLEVQELGVAAIKAGASCREIDRQVRQGLEKYRLHLYFQHGTGHGLGLEIHEPPSLSTWSEAILEENMVVTVEPGIYVPGHGGIRIEDTVIVRNGGGEVITRSDKSLLII
jgi:Xaa-Pro aminopeptidase/Xaa-Pro dipeptidase